MLGWELVVLWSTGEKSTFRYDTDDEAEQAGRRMQMALGMQVAWYGVRRVV